MEPSSLSGWRQTAFVLLLPAIKSAGKHWISAMLANQNDIKPEVVIFNVEVFNALYVSNAVQNSSSLDTTVALMVIDVVHFWISMRGTLGLLDEVKTLMPLYSVIAFHLPNGVYIQSFAALSEQQLFTNTGYVLAYSTLELISLVLAMGILKRMLGISSLHQLGFVLETQAEMVQSKLMLWFLYVMQVPLAHVGTDYSFKFKWAHTAP
ncbi:hypothetical protein BBJ29_005681 [Phytophthora kernoviae]|uniref:Uncharacterized protein n=1 Tax=Phytophthora kernoviae TaxID=325452 RepID=A0A3F2RHF1_9STRA|nr:hypothetical protein BBJ29_005681 [Phytophthora kernoviae]RLN56981.1 hypothetical protein BBP00_00007736 [Phytophthora kernoviae]